MATEKPRKTDILTPLHEGEFWRINGIAETTDKRLHEAGIHTFHQLARLNPAELEAALPGQVGVKERASRQDWTGQAGRLADGLERDEPKGTVEGPADRQHYEPFLVELLLDDERCVRRTRISQVRGGRKDSWAGWDPARLTAWIAEQAGLHQVDLTAPPVGGNGKQEHTRPRIDGELVLQDAALAVPGVERSRRFSSSGQMLELRLRVDLGWAFIPPDVEIAYQATVEAIRLGALAQSLVGQAQGTFPAQPEILLSVPLQPLAEGTYRLAVMVMVYPAGSPQPQQDGIHAIHEGGLVHIYDREPVLR